jgi:hypothetical protein
MRTRTASTLRSALSAALVLCWLAAPAVAAPLGQPTGAPVLTIEGEIGVTNAPGKAVFDLAMLERLGLVTFTTMTPWYTNPVTFEGVPMARLMETVGASGAKVVAVALNDYRIEIPTSDFREYGTILALKRDGAYMPIRDKGPLFIVYPFDERDELHSQMFYGRSVWQLSRLVVR